MQVVYQGPFNAVEVPDAGVVAVKGEPVEISDEIAKNLLTQGFEIQRTTDPATGEVKETLVPPENPQWVKASTKSKKDSD